MLLTAVAFAVAYGQAPLYFSNQNQYFLHGMAAADYGDLHNDWLAGTIDPTPAFSALVFATTLYLHPWAFYLYYGILQCAYALAMIGLFAFLAGKAKAVWGWPVFAALMVLVHAAATHWAVDRLLKHDYADRLFTGVAEQFVLGHIFQPSAFGVLLVVALCLFAHGRPLLAAVFAALAADAHATYLVPAGLLTLGFMAALGKEGRGRMSMAVGAVALVVVLPGALFPVLTFGPTSPETYAEAQRILAYDRIPHHALPQLWLHKPAMAQVIWTALGIAMTWRTRLFLPLLVPFGGAIVLTGLQIATDSPTLALIFPWRISVVLVPVATTVILARIVALWLLPLGNTAARVAAAVVLVALAGAGCWIEAERFRRYADEKEVPLMEFVSAHRAPGDVYFLPMKIPDLMKTYEIPDNFQRFRLETGAAIYVDFKSIPYKDVEVLEWWSRLRQTQAVEDKIHAGRLAEAVADLSHMGVTHLVQPASHPLAGPLVHQVYADDHYRLYQLKALTGNGQADAKVLNPRIGGMEPEEGVVALSSGGSGTSAA
jgi:hypothetical protein